MFTQALERFALPGEADFPLNAYFEKPKFNEADELRKYFTQVIALIKLIKCMRKVNSY